MKRRRVMDKLSKHPFTIRIANSEYVKCAFYCEECDRYYSIRYMDRHHRTYKHQRNLLVQENVPRIHPYEVKDIFQP